LLNKYLDEVEATLDNRQVKDPITNEERKPDERFLRSVEDKIKISESGKLSFRQEVVRKAMGAYKRGEKFTLDSHAQLHDAIEQYLFEQRRDVLRLVSSTARPDEETKQKISVVEKRPRRRVRLRQPQRARGAQLRDHPARAGVISLVMTDQPGSKPPPSRPSRIAARRRGTTCSRAARATGCATTRKCAKPCAASFRNCSPAAT
jgi:hypothetical protein